MKNKQIINPIGLKGKEIHERQLALMGIKPINENENKSNHAVELTKIGPDGNAYAVVRENHEYYIKISAKTKDLVLEDFKYIGGLQNKKSEAYPSYAKAIKQLNLKFKSLSEAYNRGGDINVFEDDNLLSEHHPLKADMKLSATKGIGDNQEYVVNKKGKELSYDAKEGKEEDGFGDNVAKKDVEDEFEKVKVNEGFGMGFTGEGNLNGDRPMSEYDEKAMQSFIDQYGEEKGKQVYYATANKEDRDPETFKKEVDEVELNEFEKAIEEMMARHNEVEEPVDYTMGSKDPNQLPNPPKEIIIPEDSDDKELSDKQKKIAALAGNPDKIGADDLEKVRAGALDELYYEESIEEAIKRLDALLEGEVKKKSTKVNEEAKYTLKLDAPAQEAPAPVPAEPISEPADEAGFGDLGGDEKPAKDDKPFDDEPFDAGVEADEETDPKKFIEQLTGKLGQSLRKYTEEQGQPDFDLEKFAINSLISATHTAEMDEEDRNDIIKKINTAGDEEDSKDSEDNVASDEESTSLDSGDSSDAGDASSNAEPSGSDKGEEELSFNESEMGNLFLENPPKNNLFQPGSNKILDEGGDGSQTRYMFFSNLEQLRRQAGLLLDMDQSQIEEILNNGHDWAADHIAEAKNNMDQVFDFLMNETKSGDMWKSVDMEDYEDEYSEWSKPMEIQQGIPVSSDLAYHLQNEIALGESIFRYGSDKFFSLLKEVKSLYSKGLIKLNENDEFIVNDFDNSYIKVGDDKIKMNFIFEEVESETINEAEYQGKTVKLGKPKRGGSKKFYVYVKNPKTGKIKKVSFGAKSGGGNLAVKLRDAKARKAFADRHNCEQKNDKTQPGYWACRLPRYAKLLGLSGGGRWW